MQLCNVIFLFLNVAIQEISDLASRQHYQIACQRYFEVVHHGEIDGGIQHPNQYFQESQKILNGEKTVAKSSAHKVQTIYASIPVKEEVIQLKNETTNNDVIDNQMDSDDDDYNYSTIDI